ncbi:MAG TPA: hypothetical protein P5160_03545, partial [Candidatus Omnitrophota bacterium]|nr:hypothetical protein [Candidatus Omnitrophota bacterium]
MEFKRLLAFLRHGPRSRFNKWKFDYFACKVVKSPAITSLDGRLALVSLISSRDFYMYLVAVKSVVRFIKTSKIFVINDGSLRAWQIAQLKRQIKDVVIAHISDIKNDYCPKGACWERLLFIADLLNSYYVFELDSDILALKSIEEVIHAINKNQGFMLTDKEDIEIISLNDAVYKSKGKSSEHIQDFVEQNLDVLCEECHFYIHGSGGFIGYPRGAFDRGRVEGISQKMFNRCGKRWAEWGTEKITSSLLFANMESKVILT